MKAVNIWEGIHKSGLKMGKVHTNSSWPVISVFLEMDAAFQAMWIKYR